MAARSERLLYRKLLRIHMLRRRAGPPSLSYGRQARPGHGAFDVDKPEAVQRGMDQRDSDRASRLKGGRQ